MELKKNLMGVKFDAKEISMSGSLDLKDDNGKYYRRIEISVLFPTFWKSYRNSHDEKTSLGSISER